MKLLVHLSCVFALSALMLNTGCSNFEHALDWEPSALNPKLLGQWVQEIDGDSLTVDISVNPTDEESLHFDLTFDEAQASKVRSEKEYVKATVSGQFLASSGVQVLQLNADTYQEFDSAGEEIGSGYSGYVYWRLQFDEKKNDVAVRSLEIDEIVSIAFSSDSLDELTYLETEFDECVSKVSRSWDLNDVAIQLLELEKEGQIEIANESLKDELLDSVAKYKEREVRPLQRLKNLQGCVVRKLPADALGFLFEHHADEIFNGEDELHFRRS